jgi:hypothetical protein
MASRKPCDTLISRSSCSESTTMSRPAERWSELSDHIVEFHGKNGEVLTIDGGGPSHGLASGALNFLIQFSRGEPGRRAAAEMVYYDYSCFKGFVDGLGRLHRGEAECLHLGGGEFEIEVSVRRDLLRPRYWIRGHLMPASERDASKWGVLFDFEWCPVDAQGTLQDTLRQAEQLLTHLRELDYPY